MEPARLSRPIICLALAACAAALPSTAQESLDTVLDRGYIRQWLVCGPFKPDVAGGIVAALERGEAPLGDTDFMDPLGGIGRVRPKHLLKVETDDGVAIWQMAGATDETLDLAPFFPDAREGLSYAGFYAKAATPRTVYLDVQSPLGVRIFFNGFPARAIRPAPITATGVDRFTLVFRAGLNLLVMEVPGATFEALAELDNTGASEFKARALMNRPLLTGKSGFEIGLRILPLEEFGPIAYVPRLASSGTFSGWAEDPRQDVTVTLFNPLPVMSPPIILEAQAGEAGPATTATVPGVPPESQREVILGIPTGDLSSGQALRVNVSIEAEGEKTSFMGSVNVLPRPRDGKVYFITGLRYRPESPEDQRTATQRLMEECARHMALLTEEPDYGFDLGPIHLWKAFVTAHPAQRSAVRYAVGMSRCAPRAGYGHPDERLVCGELLVRNLAYGRIAAERLLGDAGMSFDAWGLSGVCPQLPQLVAGAGLAGVVSNLPVRGVPEFFWHEGLDNTRVLHRRKTPSGGPRSLRDLRDMVAVQRRELLERGIPSDLLISESVVTPPEPFFLGACERLGRSVPAIMVTGAGGGELFADTRELVLRGAAELPVAARAMNAVRLGELLAQPDLKRAHAELEADLCAAEMFATFAALFGAEYPESALDLAWRHLMYASAPERLGFAPTPRAYVDALAAYREAAEYANAVLDRSMAYLAERADVYANAPSPSENVLALVVFNASSMQRTDV
ncbi:MAG TPA: hypothetical protein HPP83_11020, partial [Candidatus Hydrogenedentes bacterium]|nr:hypothetical protein [Candidatus Hydrogenedentota bacterium]